MIKDLLRNKDINKLANDLVNEIGESEFLTAELNEFQQKAFDSESAEKFIFGGNRSGKSYFCAYVIAKLASGEYSIRNNPIKSKYKVWISSLDANLTKQVIIPLLEKVVPKKWLRINANRNWAKIRSSYGIAIDIDFKSMDSGRTKYQGASVDLIILDEEHTEEIYKECKMRTLDCKGQIITAMTPLLGMTWVSEYAHKHFNIKFPTRANKTLSQDEIESISEGLTENERKMRLEGEFVDLSGLKFIDGDDIKYLSMCKEEPTSTWKWDGETFYTVSSNGELVFYVNEIECDAKFVLGTDIATGNGRDYTTVKVFKIAERLEEVAFYRSNTTTIPQIVNILYIIGKMFNDACINLEKNGMGMAVLQGLIETKSYLNFAGRVDRETGVVIEKLCYSATGQAREFLLQSVKKALQKRNIVIKSAQSHYEWACMQYNERKHRYDHLQNRNDDCVFADALAWQTAEQLVSGNYFEKKTKKQDIEDYYSEWDKYVKLNSNRYDYEQSEKRY